MNLDEFINSLSEEQLNALRYELLILWRCRNRDYLLEILSNVSNRLVELQNNNVRKRRIK